MRIRPRTCGPASLRTTFRACANCAALRRTRRWKPGTTAFRTISSRASSTVPSTARRSTSTRVKRLAGDASLNMTRLALNLSEYVNGVAKRHAEVSRQMFPGYHVHAITNGVHPFTWVADSFRALFDQYVPSWCHEPELLVRVDGSVPDEAVWHAHQQAKQTLIDAVSASTGVSLNATLPILGFARRMTEYKRPDLLFTDLDRLQGDRARAAVSDRARRQGASARRRRQAFDRTAAEACARSRRRHSDRVPRRTTTWTSHV